jgi:hypothetical protein
VAGGRQHADSIPDLFRSDIFERDGTDFSQRRWAYVGLEIEIPNSGDFKVTRVGTTSVVITRDANGAIHGFVIGARTAALKVCRHEFGNTASSSVRTTNGLMTRPARRVPFIKGVFISAGCPTTSTAPTAACRSRSARATV